jgi:hypothetical protein
MNIDDLLALIDEVEKQYYNSKPTSPIALHPFKELKLRIKK